VTDSQPYDILSSTSKATDLVEHQLEPRYFHFAHGGLDRRKPGGRKFAEELNGEMEIAFVGEVAFERSGTQLILDVHQFCPDGGFEFDSDEQPHGGPPERISRILSIIQQKSLANFHDRIYSCIGCIQETS